MIKIDVRGIDDVKRKLSAMPGEIRDKAVRPALNKVAEKAKSEIARAIPEEFAVKAADVRSSIDLRRAGGQSLTAVIDVWGSTKKRGRSLNLIHFLAAIAGQKTRGSSAKSRDARKLEQQLGFLIKKGGGLKGITGAFLGNKGRTIFIRTEKGTMSSRGRYAGTKHAQAIEAVQVIGYAQMFNSRRINRRVLDKVRAELPLEIDRAMAMLKARGIL